jgi:hypothetical protein
VRQPIVDGSGCWAVDGVPVTFRTIAERMMIGGQMPDGEPDIDILSVTVDRIGIRVRATFGKVDRMIFTHDRTDFDFDAAAAQMLREFDASEQWHEWCER